MNNKTTHIPLIIKILFFVIFTLLLCLTICACSGNTVEGQLTSSNGFWEWNNYDLYIKFDKDGTYKTYDEDDFSFFRSGYYKITDTEILLKWEEPITNDSDVHENLKYSFSNKELNIDGIKFITYDEYENDQAYKDAMSAIIDEHMNNKY